MWCNLANFDMLSEKKNMEMYSSKKQTKNKKCYTIMSIHSRQSTLAEEAFLALMAHYKPSFIGKPTAICS